MALQGIAQEHIVAAVSLVEGALGDPEHDVRLAAIEALRALPSTRATALLRSVRDDDTESLDLRALAAAFTATH
jgi:HEAT repeat protein